MATDPAHRWSMREVAAFLAGGPTAEAPTATTPAAPRSVPAPPPRTEAPASAAGVVEEPEPNDSTTQRSHRARRAGPSPVLLVLLGAAVAAVAGLVIWQMLGASPQETPLAGSPSSEATAEPTETASSTDSESPSAPESSEDEAADTAAQEEAMEEFISDYLTTVTSDPEATWQQLTPAFRRQSGGFQGYTGYWDTIAEARVLDISADAEAQPATVTYSVQYTRQNGSTFTDVVTLELRKSDNSFLISGES